MSRLLQVFAPGIPQVYYVGLLAGKNDIELLEKTKEGRNINRHYYTSDEIATEVKRPVVAALLNLLRFRNQTPAFDLEGSIDVQAPSEYEITIVRSNKDASDQVSLTANLQTLEYTVKHNGQVVVF